MSLCKTAVRCALLLLLVSCTTIELNAQTSFSFETFEGSRLPLVLINTSDTIVDEPRVIAAMKIIHQEGGGMNHPYDDPTDYNGRISIEIRGNTSQSFPKRSFALETQDSLGNNNNVSVLGMPEENDWVLYGPYSDKTMMRNAIIYELGDRIDRYTVRRRYCELFINENYRGVYLFMESVKRDENRIDIAKLLPSDTIGDELTGGYIMKVDRMAGEEDGWISDYPSMEGGAVWIQLWRPKGPDLHPVQRTYIEEYVGMFENLIFGDDFSDPSAGYDEVIDVQSFVDLSLANELSKNIDGYKLSTFFFKEKDSDGGKIVMGPWWDYNIALGNADYCEAVIPEGYVADTDCGTASPMWFERLRTDPSYEELIRSTWKDYRSDVWSNFSIDSMIDSLAAVLSEPQKRDHARWPRLGQYVWPNAFMFDRFEEEVQFLRDWLDTRLIWLDQQFGLIPTANQHQPAPKIYPQPTAGLFRIKMNSEIALLRIYDTMGKIVEEKEHLYSYQTFDIQHLPNGCYFIECVLNDKQVVTSKLLKSN
ncbi:MAG: spore coat protein CotH [Crocinitomicaceae bacterium]|nr:spore coat protein CotH [Crocinitomicaceae bacterium]